MKKSVTAFTPAQANAMGFIKGHLTPAQIAWNRFKYRFVAWITMGRVELQFKEYAPKADDGQLPYEEIDDTFSGPPLAALPVSAQPTHPLVLKAMPEPAQPVSISKSLSAMETCFVAKRTRPKSGHIRPTKRGGSPKSRFRK